MLMVRERNGRYCSCAHAKGYELGEEWGWGMEVDKTSGVLARCPWQEKAKTRAKRWSRLGEWEWNTLKENMQNETETLYTNKGIAEEQG